MHTAVAVEDPSESINRKRDPHHARGAWPRAWLLGVATLLAACTQGPGGGGIGLAAARTPDPATVDFPIFYIRHQVPEDQDDVTRVRPFVEDDDYSATLWKRDRAPPALPETELTARLRVDPHRQGRRPLRHQGSRRLARRPARWPSPCAARSTTSTRKTSRRPGTSGNTTSPTDTLHRVITSDIIAEEGQDVAPSYLPDGRILFSSTRQRQSKAILLDEDKAQFEATTEARNESAFVLHVMNADGTDIHQITFNPVERPVWPRCCRTAACCSRAGTARRATTACTCTPANPDGTDTQLHYGALSHITGTAGRRRQRPPIEFMRAREMSDGRLMVLTRERTDVDFGGNLTIIDTKNFVENTQPLPPAPA